MRSVIRRMQLEQNRISQIGDQRKLSVSVRSRPGRRSDPGIPDIHIDIIAFLNHRAGFQKILICIRSAGIRFAHTVPVLKASVDHDALIGIFTVCIFFLFDHHFLYERILVLEKLYIFIFLFIGFIKIRGQVICRLFLHRFTLC